MNAANICDCGATRCNHVAPEHGTRLGEARSHPRGGVCDRVAGASDHCGLEDDVGCVVKDDPTSLCSVGRRALKEIKAYFPPSNSPRISALKECEQAQSVVSEDAV